MLKLRVIKAEDYDETTSQFVANSYVDLELEHSLLSLSKWESHWEIPFLGHEEKTHEQILHYIACMNLRGEFPEDLFNYFKPEHFDAINKYIEAKMTATWFANESGKTTTEIITAEVIYYWIIELGIPFETQEWHLNRLLTLVKVCNLKRTPAKKMSRRDAASQRSRLNEERKARLNSRG